MADVFPKLPNISVGADIYNKLAIIKFDSSVNNTS